MLREALKRMGREDLICNSKKHLVPVSQPAVMVAIRQTDYSAFKFNNQFSTEKYVSLPKSFNNMKNVAIQHKKI